jgi:hypothetical protein
MTQALVKLEEHEDRILNIVKGKYGFRNKSDAIRFVIGKFEEELLEPELRPEYVEKLEKIKRQQGHRFRSMAELKRHIENA